MLAETAIYNALKTLVSSRVFPDVAPANTATPYITYAKVGGAVIAPLANEVPSKVNGRFQINVWGSSRSSVSTLILQVESAMILMSAVSCRPLGSSMSTYEPDGPTYGAMQDFTIWHSR